MGSVKSAFDSIGEIVQKLPTLYENMGALGMSGRAKGTGKGQAAGGGGGMLDTLVSNLKSMMIKIGDLFGTMDSVLNARNFNAGNIETQMQSVFNAMETVRKLARKMAKMGGKGGVFASTDGAAFKVGGRIKSFIKSLNTAFDDADLGGLKEKINTFVTSIKTLLEQLNKLGENGTNTINVTITIKGTVKGTQQVINKIKQAINKIKAQCNSRTFTKHVYINIQRHVSIGGDSMPSDSELSGGAGGGGGGFFHRGGYVRPLYRAKGGDIFKPKGTDRIPAMLSRGEFVQKKAAVDFWGARFMQKINNLDVNGAMRELSARANHYMSINRGMTITNNTTNNNNVTQNINTSNPNFAFRRANRYVGAL